MTDETLLQLDLPGIRKLKSGKVREIFDLDDRLLMVGRYLEDLALQGECALVRRRAARGGHERHDDGKGDPGVEQHRGVRSKPR